MKNIRNVVLAWGCILSTALYAGTGVYRPDWESLDARKTPAWFSEAKFGIFIHWGVYSVPAWGPKGKYAEWYWKYMQDPKGPTWAHHTEMYGEKFKYQDFAPMFKAEMFNPDQWADTFVKSGAKYIVLTSKHHEGFCLWPSEQSWNWNSIDIGPHRDLAGDLSKAVRARNIRMGFYYSLYEWFNPTYLSDPKRYSLEHMHPQMKDLINRYKPDLLWTDGEWEHPEETWYSREFLTWLFNESPVKDTIAVNDRWGKTTRGKHGGYYTTEYMKHADLSRITTEHPWEECRGMGASFGYNRNEDAADYKSATELLHTLITTVSNGGNLLLDIGPTADGRIPVEMEERLLAMGDWLKINGEAIYETKAWRVTGENERIRYTSKGNAIYAICFDWPKGELVLASPQVDKDVKATLLGYQETLKCRKEGEKLHIEIPALTIDEVPCRHAYVVKLEGVR